ncbi:hypothetical protein FQR65_LT07201 [Abscondita terminalis]|nr:hypothetical protein FQR65_LT07201 [Abscondita terminalis]
MPGVLFTHTKQKDFVKKPKNYNHHLYDALQSKEEMQIDFARMLDEKVTAEKCKFKLQVSSSAARVNGIDQAFKESEIIAVKNAAVKDDELVNAVIEAIPKIAIERGVFPEDSRHLALVPDGVKAATPIPQAELNDETVDFTDFSTNDILQRARYWVDRGDFEQSLKYMNLLDGAVRCVASGVDGGNSVIVRNPTSD